MPSERPLRAAQFAKWWMRGVYLGLTLIGLFAFGSVVWANRDAVFRWETLWVILGSAVVTLLLIITTWASYAQYETEGPDAD